MKLGFAGGCWGGCSLQLGRLSGRKTNKYKQILSETEIKKDNVLYILGSYLFSNLGLVDITS